MTKGKKHMDGTKRCRIQFGLEAGESARAIAKEIGVSLSTVSREIGKHTYESFKGCHRSKLVYVAGRAHEDYQAFLAANPGVAPVFMDPVIGRPGGACLLTLHWPGAGFMVGIPVPNKCAANVVAVFDRPCDELFPRLFPALLTDRGTELSYPSRVEACEDGTKRTRVFFCDPMNSNQKSQLERNHELVREILPKGVSFDGLTQAQASLALSHVNAYVRHAQDDRTPFEVFDFLYGEGTATKLHIERPDPRDVVLKPRLVGIGMK